MNGVTGRMGTNQHLVRSILAIREQGGVAAPDELLWPEPLLVGRDERKLRALAEPHGLDAYTTDLDAALADPLRRVLRRPGDEPPRGRGARGDRGRPPRLLREADHRGPRVGARAGAARRRGRRQARRGAGQAVPAGHPDAQARARQRRARPRAVGARRVRLLGLPRARPGAAAAVVELPGAGRRRHRRRHVRPLALRARRAVRLGARGVRARRDPPPGPLRRAGRAVRRDRRGRRVRDVRARRTA